MIYNNGTQIVQGPGYVAIRYEMIHETKIIPLDGSPHPGKNIKSYMGDSRGHWEGNTLVIETTNFLGDKNGIGLNGGGTPHSADMVLTEKWTRVAPDMMDYDSHHQRSGNLDCAVDHPDASAAEPGVPAVRVRLP